MNKKYSNSQKSFIYDKVEELQSSTWNERLSIIKDEFKDRFSEILEVKDWECLRVMYSRIKSNIDEIRRANETIDELNSSIEEDKTYEVDWDDYIFKKKRFDSRWDKYIELIRIPISLIDEIFFDYSSHWKDMSQQEIIDKYKLKPDVWIMIKSRFELNKFSNVISPEGLSRLEQKWEEFVEERIKLGCYEAIEDKFKSRFKLEYYQVLESQMKKLSRRSASIENYLEFLREYIDWYKPREFDFEKIHHPEYTNDTIDVGISDLHIGNRNTTEIVQRIIRLTQYLVARNERNINILCLGDLVETLVEGGMHPWQTEWMSWLYGHELIMSVVNVLEGMINELVRNWKNVSFYWIGWNHDRIGRSHSDDQYRTGALVIYELMKRWLQNVEAKIEIIKEKTSSLDLDNFVYIINHWDEWFDKLVMERTLWKYGDKSRHNIIMYWDKHHIDVDETMGATKIGLPALAWKGDYDTRHSYFSESWVVLVTRNEDNLPDITIKRMK